MGRRDEGWMKWVRMGRRDEGMGEVGGKWRGEMRGWVKWVGSGEKR